MIKRVLAVAGAACVMGMAATSAQAAPCAGFTDVDDTNQFCPNVEWVKNRSVTLGCTSTTLYCPADPVTRLAMAAFLNRLGTALTPVFLSGLTNAAATDITVAGGFVGCQTADYAVNGFPRTAVIDSWNNVYEPNGNIDVSGALVVSANGGTSWTQLANTDKYMTLYTPATPPNDMTFSTGGTVALNVGTTYRFGVRFTRLAGTGTSVKIYCTQRVQVISRDGASSPLDEPADAGR